MNTICERHGRGCFLQIYLEIDLGDRIDAHCFLESELGLMDRAVLLDLLVVILVSFI